MKAPVAKLAYLTQPAPGVILLNIQIEGREFERVEVTRDQLANMVVEGAALALKERA
ncbi:hypothetical protein AB8A05_04050 [Tardiphaga sp. 538_B7_N1_4]|uniref:hypothetical protein n=1 Tax=Tardiphaga sp. 538_B7_N1_4 TaxID=3240778 RepID=UPI003F27A46F